MTGLSRSTLIMDEVPLDQVQRVTGPLEILSMGPLRARMIGGLFASDGVVTSCAGLTGELAMTPFRVDGEVYLQIQMDLAHGGSRTAGSFALSLADAESLFERLKAPLAIARLESAQ